MMYPKIIAPDKAERYYYEKDVLFSLNKTSEWRGKGAEVLGLEGNVNQYAFRKITRGSLPGTIGRVVKKGPGKERAGIDFPFSPPKSVSIMALHCGDDKLIDAHKKAVNQVIDYIENRYIYTKKTVNKKTRLQKHRKGIFATFTHSTNRENDPHLHTHMLLMNMVKTGKDKYQALVNDFIFKDRPLFVSAYQGFLKQNVEALGYKTRLTKNAFEIDGVSEEVIRKFSKRDEAIRKREAELEILKPNLSKKANRRQAFLDTRKTKNTIIKPNELKVLWAKEADPTLIMERVKKVKGVAQEDFKYERFNEKMNICAKVLCAKEAVFKNSFLLTTVSKILNVNILEAEKFVNRAVQEEQLVPLTEDKKGPASEKLWTTRRMVEIEKTIVREFKEGRDQAVPLIENEKSESLLLEKFAWLTTGQKEAVLSVLGSRNTFSIIQGDAGTGKTASMLAVKNIFKEQIDEISKTISNKIRQETLKNIEPEKIKKVISKAGILGMGFTGKAASELNKGSGIESSTIHSFLNRNSFFEKECLKNSLSDKESSLLKNHFSPVWIVDESSMVASTQMKDIVDRAIDEKARVVFIGDGKQLSSIGAGRMFSDLQRMECVDTIKMSEVMRQKTEHMKKVVSLIKSHIKENEEKDRTETKHLEEAFNILKENNSLHQVSNFEKIVEDYVARNDIENTTIICQGNESRKKLNQELREKILSNNEEKVSLTCKTPVSLDGVKQCYAENYSTNFKIFIQKGNDEIEAGSILKIKEINANSDKNELICENSKGKTIKIDPLYDDLALSPFTETKRNFKVGEKIVFNKNDKHLNVQNGLTGIISEIDERGRLSVNIGEQKRNVSFHINHYNWLDYGYAVTTYKSQGGTYEHVMLASFENTSFMENANSLYVASTRAEKSMSIYSDQIDNCIESFKLTKEKTSTLDYGMEM